MPLFSLVDSHLVLRDGGDLSTKPEVKERESFLLGKRGLPLRPPLGPNNHRRKSSTRRDYSPTAHFPYLLGLPVMYNLKPKTPGVFPHMPSLSLVELIWAIDVCKVSREIGTGRV